jgi:hypothetical protein
MHDMCDTREMCEARKSRSSRACRASITWPVYARRLGAPRPEVLRAYEASNPVGHYTYAQLSSVGIHLLHCYFFTYPNNYLDIDTGYTPIPHKGY